MDKKVKYLHCEIDGQPIPFLVHREFRSSVRFAVGKRGILIRLPSYFSKKDEALQLQRAISWVKSLKEKKPEILKRYQTRTYHSGDKVEIFEKSYILDINLISDQSKYSRAKLNNGTITINIAEKDPVLSQKTIKTLLSRVISQDRLPGVKRRVQELNHQYFQQEIGNIRLKYNHSNWGSCSTKGNINLSSRLLFAPDDVQDYVIIHELAHLLEHNHSSRFWALVEKAVPDYKVKERWLKMNGSKCDF